MALRNATSSRASKSSSKIRRMTTVADVGSTVVGSTDVVVDAIVAVVAADGDVVVSAAVVVVSRDKSV